MPQGPSKEGKWDFVGLKQDRPHAREQVNLMSYESIDKGNKGLANARQRCLWSGRLKIANWILTRQRIYRAGGTKGADAVFSCRGGSVGAAAWMEAKKPDSAALPDGLHPDRWLSTSAAAVILGFVKRNVG